MDAGDPEIAIDGRGYSVVVWTQYRHGTIRLRRRTPGQGWSRIYDMQVTGAGRPAIAMGRYGVTATAWVERAAVVGCLWP